jgi:23S rRNA pseudouridine1911/1915/1917 synthase
VHRLDKDTSGALVVAKNERALTALQAAFKGRDVEKVYLAIVLGEPKDHAIIETLYGRHPRDRKRFTGKVREGKQAKTEYRTVERFEGAALVEVTLHTGRTHQIRVHLAEAGLPLLGDAVYGKRAKRELAEAEAAIGRQALHAWKLAFDHPRTKKHLSFEAKLPEDFEAALNLLRANPRAKRGHK